LFRKIYIIFIITFFAAIFINGFFIGKQRFKEQINGIVLKKREGSKGSVVLLIKPSTNLDSFEYIFGGRQIYDAIQIGDSIVKNRNSYTLYLYKKENNNYGLTDSMEISHWGFLFIF